VTYRMQFTCSFLNVRAASNGRDIPLAVARVGAASLEYSIVATTLEGFERGMVMVQDAPGSWGFDDDVLFLISNKKNRRLLSYAYDIAVPARTR
jgi:hypothetical protein